MVTEREIAEFAAACEEMRRQAYLQMGYNLTINNPHVGFTIGKRYARLTTPNGSNLDGSAYCFVDMATGDILKTASWSTPAKGARGHIRNGAADMTPYGAAYRR